VSASKIHLHNPPAQPLLHRTASPLLKDIIQVQGGLHFLSLALSLASEPPRPPPDIPGLGSNLTWVIVGLRKGKITGEGGYLPPSCKLS